MMNKTIEALIPCLVVLGLILGCSQDRDLTSSKVIEYEGLTEIERVEVSATVARVAFTPDVSKERKNELAYQMLVELSESGVQDFIEVAPLGVSQSEFWGIRISRISKGELIEPNGSNNSVRPSHSIDAP